MNKLSDNKAWLMFASLMALLSIAIGAFAAHGLKHSLNEYALSIIDTGVRYQMFASVSLFIMLWVQESLNTSFRLALLLQSLGLIMFSFSLYALALSAVKTFAFITPLGGVCLLISWMSFMYSAFKHG